MSRPGNPFDNAKAESFIKTLKTEVLNARTFQGIADTRTRIDDFIANIYNTESPKYPPADQSGRPYRRS